jgi:virulence factor Mce-like protein
VRRLLAALSIVALAAGAAVLTAAEGGGARGSTYKVVFDNAFGLAEGGDFKIAGVRAGETTGFKVSEQRPRKAVVEFAISEPGVARLREDATCEIRPQSLIGEYFVDCQPGSSGARLKEGATIPVEQTSSTIPIDLVNAIMRRPYRERFRLILAELGTGLAGRGGDLSEVLRRAHPGLRETSRALRILGSQRETIKRFVSDAETVTAQLENRKADLARWVEQAGQTATITAGRREDLKRNFQRLPGFLDELRPYMVELEGLADEQIPLLADLQTAAPDLDRFLARLGPFAEASRPAFRGLGEASSVGTRAFRASEGEVAKLRQVARKTPALAKPLRQLLETLDDRSRAIEIDPRAKATAPPAPDKTAIASEGGFTGFEGLYDYFFWQALALNGRDDVGHVLKLLGVADVVCAEFYATREGSEETFDRCNQFLGPDQPGVTTPDPTGGPDPVAASTASTALRHDAGARSAGGPSGRGERPAAEQPGITDGAGELLGPAPDARGGVRPVAPAPAAPSDAEMPGQLLDYLLGP